MRIRKKKWAEPELSVCDFYVKNPEEHAGNWSKAFKKEQPLYLEIGCGKGGFAGQFALQNPDKNIIALDIKIDMLGVGRRTIVRLFEEAAEYEYDGFALYELGYIHECRDTRESLEAAADYYQKAAAMGNENAAKRLSHFRRTIFGRWRVIP